MERQPDQGRGKVRKKDRMKSGGTEGERRERECRESSMLRRCGVALRLIDGREKVT